uniref:Zinc finger protein n=1 Tax=Loa loa TaxID=7209 RepID=A0A1I7VYF9_LOALO
MYERRIGLSALSAPYVREEQIEFKEIDQNDARSLNASIQEVRREQTSIGNMPKKIWHARYQNETSNERYQNETSIIQTIERKQSKGNEGNIKRKQPGRTNHTGEKPFKSGISKEDFIEPSSTHIRIHTGKRTFYCWNCTANFTRLGSLQRHMWTHAGKKPFSCLECDKNFALKEYLLKHIKIHAVWDFTRKESLHKHMRTHTGEKPHSCSKCGMNFADPSNRLRHMIIIHTGGKLHNCSVCNKTFSLLHNMKRHMKIHDNDRQKFSCP